MIIIKSSFSEGIKLYAYCNYCFTCSLYPFSYSCNSYLQSGKGAAMGSGLGAGSSQTMFGSSGAGNFLTKMTTAIATLFMMYLSDFGNNVFTQEKIPIYNA